MRTPQPPIPNTPAKLAGSFNYGLLAVTPETIMDDFLTRVEREPDPIKKLIQAQRAIGALMALSASGVGRAGSVFFHRDCFARLSALTEVEPNDLVTMAGVAR